MPLDEPTSERLAELLNDERARRAWAENQLEKETEKTRIWRQRAEERAAEIRRLRRKRQSRERRVETTGRERVTANVPSTPPPTVKSPPNRPLHATTLAGVCDAPDWVGSMFDTVEVSQSGIALESVDLVVAGSDRALAYLETWLELPARPPLLLTGRATPEVWAPRVGPRDAAIGIEVAGIPSIPSRPLVDPLPEVEPGNQWVAIDRGVSLDEIVHLSARGLPVRLGNDVVAPPGSEGLIGEGDPRKGAVLTRLRAHRQFGLEAFARTVGEAIGISLPDTQPSVATLLVTNRPARLREALTGISNFRFPRVELVLGAHGSSFDDVDLDSVVGSWSESNGLPVRVLRLPDEMSLGECLNRAADSTGASVIAKVDDDDIYGPHYLDEAVDVLSLSNADLVGKATFAVLLERSDDLVLQSVGKENAEVSYVPGASFVMPRSTWERLPFAHRRSRVDSTFVRGLRARDMTIWSSSRFELVVRRTAEAHTWTVSDRLLRAQGEHIGKGTDIRRMFLEDPEV